MYLIKEWVHVKSLDSDGEIIGYKDLGGKRFYFVKVANDIKTLCEEELSLLDSNNVLSPGYVNKNRNGKDGLD